jgi:hypothetical protein
VWWKRQYQPREMGEKKACVCSCAEPVKDYARVRTATRPLLLNLASHKPLENPNRQHHVLACTIFSVGFGGKGGLDEITPWGKEA